MMGSSHAVSGLAVGAMTLPLAPVHDVPSQLAWVAACGGCAYLPDLDQPGSTGGRVWGPVTGWLARIIGFLGRGHRGGSHDVLLGTLGFALAFAAASTNLYTSVVAVGLVIALAIHALDNVIPGNQRLDPVPSALLSLTWSWMLVGHSEFTWWLPFAAAVGVVTHITGDALTTEGVPVPLSWLSRRRTVGLRLFNAGARPEKWITYACIGLTVAGTLWWTLGERLTQLFP